MLIAALVFALFADLSSTMRNHRTMRYLINPVNSLYALVDLALQSQARPSGPPQVIGLDARILPRAPGTKPPLMVLVIGETARADHFALNGYAQPTNPELGALGVLSLRQVMSCGTNTAASLPCMFSHLGKAAYESREMDHENLLDLVQRAGMAVLWIDNQAGCKGLCARVANAYAHDAVARRASPLPHRACATATSASTKRCCTTSMRGSLPCPPPARERGVLLVLHQMGSHGPAYFEAQPRRAASRSSPSARPTCCSNAIAKR